MLYRSDAYDLRLYDASCLNSTSYFDQVIAQTLTFVVNNPDADNTALDAYILDNFGLSFSGQADSLNSATIEIQIIEQNTGTSDTVDVTFVPGSQSNQGETLLSEDGTITIFINDPNPSPPTSSVSIYWVCDNGAQLTLAL
jgi:hypothetical protein